VTSLQNSGAGGDADTSRDIRYLAKPTARHVKLHPSRPFPV